MHSRPFSKYLQLILLGFLSAASPFVNADETLDDEDPGEEYERDQANKARYFKYLKSFEAELPDQFPDSKIPLDRAGIPGVLPNHHHWIWMGSVPPQIYWDEMAACVEKNPDWKHSLWVVREILTAAGLKHVCKIAEKVGIEIKYIFDYELENRELIEDAVRRRSWGEASDLLRIEEWFSGLYCDTDIVWRDSEPLPNALRIQNKLWWPIAGQDVRTQGILVNKEGQNIGLSNSIIVRPYGSPLMAAYREAVRSDDGRLPPFARNDPYFRFQNHSPADMEVLKKTGPWRLSYSLTELLSQQIASVTRRDRCDFQAVWEDKGWHLDKWGEAVAVGFPDYLGSVIKIEGASFCNRFPTVKSETHQTWTEGRAGIFQDFQWKRIRNRPETKKDLQNLPGSP